MAGACIRALWPHPSGGYQVNGHCQGNSLDGKHVIVELGIPYGCGGVVDGEEFCADGAYRMPYVLEVAECEVSEMGEQNKDIDVR